MIVDLGQVQHLDGYVKEHPRDAGCILVGGPEASIAASPTFVFGPFPEHLTNGHFGELASSTVACYCIRGGALWRDGVITHNGTALWSTAMNHPEDFVVGFSDRELQSKRNLRPRHVAGQVACIYGPGYTIYGHWLTDFLPRLFVMQKSGYDIFRLRYAIPHDCPRFGLELLNLVGISSDNLLTYDPDQEFLIVDDLIVPTQLRTGSRLHSLFYEATKYWLERALPEAAAPNAHRRLFVSRSDIHSQRNLANRSVIESLASSAGFEIVHPQKMALHDQQSLFQGARQIVGEYGSALHGVIYGSPRLHCCALRGTSFHPGFIQSNLAAAFGQTTSYVFGQTEPYATIYDYEIEPADFKRALGCLEVELQRNG